MRNEEVKGPGNQDPGPTSTLQLERNDFSFAELPSLYIKHKIGIYTVIMHMEECFVHRVSKCMEDV